jgi:DNA-binding response OmpR family regulator
LTVRYRVSPAQNPGSALLRRLRRPPTVQLMRTNTPSHLYVRSSEEPLPACEHRSTVLLVDDDDGVRALISQALRRQGHPVLEAEDGVKALAAFDAASDHIQLLIADVVMPGLRGPALAQRLRLRRADLKVLFITGALAAEDLGPEEAVLRKPFRLETLLLRVSALLATAGGSFERSRQ